MQKCAQICRIYLLISLHFKLKSFIIGQSITNKVSTEKIMQKFEEKKLYIKWLKSPPTKY